jgi:hypothetical protein
MVRGLTTVKVNSDKRPCVVTKTIAFDCLPRSHTKWRGELVQESGLPRQQALLVIFIRQPDSTCNLEHANSEVICKRNGYASLPDVLVGHEVISGHPRQGLNTEFEHRFAERTPQVFSLNHRELGTHANGFLKVGVQAKVAVLSQTQHYVLG